MAIGNRGAYLTDAPVTGNPIGNAMAQAEDNAFKYRAEQRLADEKKAKDEKEQLEELSQWNKSAKADITGYGNVDAPIRDYLMQVKERGAKITTELKNPKLSFQEKVKLSAERDSIVGNMDFVKQYPTMVNDMSKEILDGVKAGKYDPEAESLAIKTLGAIQAGDFKIDAGTGTPKVSIWERDANGNPTQVLAYQQNFGDFLKNNLQPDLKSVYKDEVAKFAKEYKPDTTETKSASGRTIYTQKVDMRPGSKDYVNAEEKAIALLSNPYEMKKVAGFAGLPITDTEGIIKYAVNDLLKGVPSTTKDLQDADLLERKRQDALDRAEKIVQATNARIKDDITDQLLNRKVSKSTLYENGVAFPKLPFKNLGGESSGINSGYIEVVTKEKGTGKYIVKGKALKTKGEKFKVGDKTFSFETLTEMANNGNEEAQLALNSYGKGDNYSTFIRTVEEDELAPLIGQTNIKTMGNLSTRLEKMNPGTKKKKVYAGVDADGKIIYKYE